MPYKCPNSRRECSKRSRNRAKSADPEAFKAACSAKTRAYAKRHPDRILMRNLLSGAKRRATERSLPFSITAEDIPIPSHCPLLGIPLTKGDGRIVEGSPTIDRIEGHKGYVPGNVWVISHRANTLKNDASLLELETLIRNLRNKVLRYADRPVGEVLQRGRVEPEICVTEHTGD